ncbi:MAG: C40 family peptidase [Vibrio gallaecicus]|uniref:C40 family peptidase n=1 Tax=Vibrio gallaecicus TaxID=552386 RepID=UPI0010C9D1F9|nr:NlpC/P60 family protein [Vibrio gallaecicus]MDN3612898.1 NlpC/P60 family protein [Vibrio gallaecicus]
MHSKKIVIAIACTFILNACSSTPPISNNENERQLLQHDSHITQSYLGVYDEWKGVPYRFGGESFRGIDCSAFVQVAVFNVTKQSVPRTTNEQSKEGIKINYKDAKSGDLVFFKTSPNTNHVGIYLGMNQFLHASTSKGVIISRLDNPYWASKFWQFRRV